jgi:ApaG protein
MFFLLTRYHFKMSSEDIYHVGVSVTSQYVAAQSTPDQNNYVFTYRVIIHNLGLIGAKLLNRYWEIVDAHGNIQKVEGIGVIGQQPYLKPGEIFEYTSGAVLTTPIGSMHGTYDMVADDGIQFKAIIPVFSLSSGLVSLH